MAVVPITNKQVVSKENINRAKQVSTKGLKSRGGNDRSSLVVNGGNLSENYAITLKDVDSSILSHVKEIMRPMVKEANEMVKVNVMYGNEERWKAVRKRGVMRDKNGIIILPLIMLKRTSVEKNMELPQGFEHDVKREHVQVIRSSKWSDKNQYTRFTIQSNINPLVENIVTTMPNFVTINYDFILWTNYMEQMNFLVESFIEQNNSYWGNSTDYKFLCNTESISDASEMNIDSERFVKSNFSMITKAYLLPEETNSVVTNKITQVKKVITPNKVVFGFEGDATDFQVGK